MKITTFQTVIMAIFAVLAIVGIFVFATYSGGAKSTVGSVTVWGTFPESDVSKAITALGAGNVDFKNVTYVQKQEETFDSDYINSVAEGSGPDLILISQEDLMRLKNTIYPIPYSSITQRQFSDSFADASAIFAQPDGIYGMPALIDPLVMYYNKTLLTSAGIAAPPSTWEAITGLIPKVTALTNSQAVTRALIAMGTYGNVHNARGILSALFFQAGVPISVLTSKGAQGSLGSDASTNGVSRRSGPPFLHKLCKSCAVFIYLEFITA
jgi:ABC-type glycerol-3-phosphate transport system substrate-binding protein